MREVGHQRNSAVTMCVYALMVAVFIFALYYLLNLMVGSPGTARSAPFCTPLLATGPCSAPSDSGAPPRLRRRTWYLVRHESSGLFGAPFLWD